MRDRRTLLRGLAALPLAGLVPATALAGIASADPIPALYAEARKLHDEVGGIEDDDEAHPIMVRWSDVELEATASRPTTLAGAIAALEWARWDYAGDKLSNGDQGDRLIFALIDGALGGLRPMGEGGARG